MPRVPPTPPHLRVLPRSTIVHASLLLAVGLLIGPPHPAARAATVTLQTGPQPGPWTTTALTGGQVTPDGRILVPSTAGSGFFRLEISAAGTGNSPLRLLQETPQEARDLAQEFLDRHRTAGRSGQLDPSTEGEPVESLALGPVAAVYYDPVVDNGRTPAYVEFKLVRSKTAGRPQTGRVFSPGPQETDARSDAGYVLVSLTHADLPIGSHAFAGSARFERLLARAAGGPAVARVVRFDDAFMVGEDAAGQVVASLGSAPYLPDPALLSLPAEGVEVTLTSTGQPASGTGTVPDLTARAAESYDALLREWRTNAVLARIHAARAAAAEEAWSFAGAGPKTVTLRLRESVVLNPSGPAAIRAASSAPGAIQVEVDEASGQVHATAVGNGESLVTLWTAAGQSSICIVDTPDPAPGSAPTGAALQQDWIPGKQAGWYLANEVLISSWDEQVKYDQIWYDAQMCPGTVSGCGPTAWAIFYGNWDLKSSPKLFGRPDFRDAPHTMGDPIRDSILECTRYVFHAVDEVCFDKLERAATLPNKMERGLQWASSRGVAMTGNLKWGIPFLCPGAQTKALDSIKAGRISIVGIGAYSHYPVAYGYRRWEWRGKHGTVWDVTYHLRMNLGWGSDHAPEWRDIRQLWYATNIQPQ